MIKVHNFHILLKIHGPETCEREKMILTYKSDCDLKSINLAALCSLCDFKRINEAMHSVVTSRDSVTGQLGE